MVPIRDDADLLDGCDLDFVPHANTNEEEQLLPLFPDGVADEAKAAEWRELFGGA